MFDMHSLPAANFPGPTSTLATADTGGGAHENVFFLISFKVRRNIQLYKNKYIIYLHYVQYCMPYMII